MKLTFDKTEKESQIWIELGGAERIVIRKSTIYRGIKIFCRYQLYRSPGKTDWQERSKDYSFDGFNWIDDIIEVQRQTKKMGL